MALALLMTRLLFTTAMGIALAEALPAALWQRVDAAAGPADGESAEDPTALVLFLLCALLSALLVSVCVVLAARAAGAFSALITPPRNARKSPMVRARPIVGDAAAREHIS